MVSGEAAAGECCVGVAAAEPVDGSAGLITPSPAGEDGSGWSSPLAVGATPTSTGVLRPDWCPPDHEYLGPGDVGIGDSDAPGCGVVFPLTSWP